MTRNPEKTAFGAGVALAVLLCFLTVWTTIVRDDSTGAGYFMIILAVGVGWLGAGFRPAGMARAMLGVAVMQMLLGLLIATAPITATTSYGPSGALLFNGVFALLWLGSGALFHAAARGEGKAAQFG